MSKIKQKIQKKLSDKSIKELILGSGVSFIVKLSGVLFAFLFNWVVSELYGAYELGVLTSAMTIMLFGGVFTKFGVDSAFLKFVSTFKGSNSKNIIDIEKKSYLISISLSLVFTFLIRYFAEFISVSIFNKSSLTEAVKIMALGIIPFTIFSIQSEGSRALGDYKTYAFVQTSARFFFGFVILAFFGFVLKIKTNPYWVFIISLYLTLLYSTIAWYVKRKKILNEEHQLIPEETSYKNILNLSFPLLLVSSSAFLINWTDTLFLTYFGNEEDVAIYNIAIRFAMLSKIMLTSVNTVSAPKFAETYHANDMENLRKYVQNSTKLIFWVSIPILVLSMIIPKTLLGIFGEEFKVGYIALILMTFAQFVSAISGSVGSLLNMTGYQMVSQNIMLVTTGLNVLLNFLLIPPFGINGAAISGLITIVFRNLYSVWFIKHKFGFLTLYIPFTKNIN